MGLSVFLVCRHPRAGVLQALRYATMLAQEHEFVLAGAFMR